MEFSPRIDYTFSNIDLHIFPDWRCYRVLRCDTHCTYSMVVVVVFEQIRYTICATNKIILRNEQTDCCDVVSMNVSLLTIRTAVWMKRKWWANRREVFFSEWNWMTWNMVNRCQINIWGILKLSIQLQKPQVSLCNLLDKYNDFVRRVALVAWLDIRTCVCRHFEFCFASHAPNFMQHASLYVGIIHQSLVLWWND